MNIALSEWAGLLEKEYLSEFIPAGGAAVKIAVAPPERAGTIAEIIAQSAQRNGALVARVDASTTRVHMIEKVFFAIAAQVDWDALAAHWLREQFRNNGYALRDDQELNDAEALAAQRGMRAADVRAEVERWIANGVLRDYRLDKEFRTAMAMLCRAQVNPQNVSPTDSDVIKRWLRGEKANLSVLKRVQIFGRIARHNARRHLSSLAIWLSETGYSGLTLLIDVNQVTLDIPAGEATIRYTRNATLDFYEVLRQFIDDTDEVEHLLIVVVAGPGLLDHAKKNVDNYAALKMRTADEVRDRNRANPLNALVKLDG